MSLDFRIVATCFGVLHEVVRKFSTKIQNVKLHSLYTCHCCIIVVLVYGFNTDFNNTYMNSII